MPINASNRLVVVISMVACAWNSKSRRVAECRAASGSGNIAAATVLMIRAASFEHPRPLPLSAIPYNFNFAKSDPR
jgi:hypothetical protein